MELLLLGTIFKEWFCKVASCCFYMILTDSYLLYMDNFSFFGQSYNDFHIWKGIPYLGTWCKFYHYFVFHSFVQSNFSRQPVTSSGDFALLECFSQTRCLVMLIPLIKFPRQSVTIKGEFVPLEFLSQTSTFIHITSFWMYIVGFQNERKWLTAPLMVGLSFYGHCISDKVMSNTYYIFSPLFLFHCSSQVATNFTFTSDTSLTLLKCFPSNGTKKLLVKIVEHKLGRFILLSVPISQQLLRLT